MKKYLVIFTGTALIAGALIAINFVKAEETAITPIQSPTQAAQAQAETIKPIIHDIKEELRQELSIKEIRGRVICQAIGVCPPALDTTEVLIKSAKVTEVATDLIKISIFGYGYNVNLKNAKIVRNYWGASEIDEFSVGDIVNVFGHLDENNNFLIHAKTVRNVSIQKVHSVFKGVIESIDATRTTFVLKTEERGSQTVVVSPETRIIKNEIPGSFSDLQVGERAIVRGLWNKTLSQIQARVVIIGEEGGFRPFFQKVLPLKIEKIEGKIEKVEGRVERLTEKLAERIERRFEESAEAITIKRKIEDLQQRVAEILEKLKTVTTTPIAQ